MPKPIRVMIADDHPYFLMGIRNGLRKYEHIEIAYEAKNGAEALDLLHADPAVDILVLDLAMPKLDGYDVLKEIREKQHPVRTIVMTMQRPEEVIHRVTELGACGCVCKDDEPDEIYKAIEGVMKDGSYFSQYSNTALINALLHKKPPAPQQPKIEFTTQEIKIINCLRKEMTNREIARTLHLSIRSVERIRSELIHRVGAKNVIGLIQYAEKYPTSTA